MNNEWLFIGEFIEVLRVMVKTNRKEKPKEDENGKIGLNLHHYCSYFHPDHRSDHHHLYHSPSV